MTPGERERIRARVEQTCAEQDIPLTIPPDVAADVARLLTGARFERGRDG